MDKLLLVEPYNQIFRHQEVVLAFGLAAKAHEFQVARVSCKGLLKANCLSHQYLGSNLEAPLSQKLEICSNCSNSNERIQQIFPFSEHNLENFIRVENIAEIDGLMQEYDIRKNDSLKVQNIPVGRFAMYDTILRFKIMQLNTVLTQPASDYYRATLKNCLLMYYSISNLLESESFDYLAVFNSLYSFNQTICAVAKDHNIIPISLSASSNSKNPYARVLISGKDHSRTYQISRYLSKENNAATFKKKMFARTYLKHQEKSTLPWQYSVKESTASSKGYLQELRDISRHKKIIFCPLSSSDEVNAYMAGVPSVSRQNLGESLISNPYTNQIEFVEDILACASKNPNFYFVIRLHPRMFSNKREKLNSDEGAKLMEYLNFATKDLTNLIFHSGANVSIYDELKLANLVLNYMSSVGLDSMLLNIPTITIFQGHVPIDYPLTLSPVLFEREKLIDAIFETLKSELNFKDLATDWLYFSRIITTCKIPVYFLSPTLFLLRLLTFKFHQYSLTAWSMKLLRAVQNLELVVYRKLGFYRKMKYEIINASLLKVV